MFFSEILDLKTLSLVYVLIQVVMTVTAAKLIRTYRKQFLKVMLVSYVILTFAGALMLSEGLLITWIIFVGSFILLAAGALCQVYGLFRIFFESNRKKSTVTAMVFEMLFVILAVVGVSITMPGMSESAVGFMQMILFYGVVLSVPIAIFTILAAVGELEATITELNSKVQYLAYTDYLTNVHNNRSIMEKLETELERAKRYKRDFSIAVVDLDDFRRINHRYGHVFGDEVIKTFAETCVDTLRGVDVFGRYDGEMFLVILPETKASDAKTVIERIMVETKLLEWEHEYVTITFSTGVLQIDRDMYDRDSRVLVDKAEQTLRKAKDNGKDCVVVFE